MTGKEIDVHHFTSTDNPMKNRITFAAVVIAIALSSPMVSWGQAAGGTSGTQSGGQSQPSTGNQPSGGNSRSSSQTTTQPSNQQQNSFEMPRQIFLSGSVRLGDGSIPPASVVIER